MVPGDSHDTAYTDMAEKQLHAWALSDDEPEGTLWDLYCDLVGVDPETLANGVRYERRKRLQAMVSDAEAVGLYDRPEAVA